ncbi:MAG: NAD(P)H-dependent oxidoreductase subunit E [Deltaproteobacteria bacterium]|nr:NAD(P)H-dependent oxidoreductase subunit E [Deltaproteobacteria bacterium]
MTIEVSQVANKHKGKRGSLISILQDIQDKYHYLPTQALEEVSQLTGHSLVDIYGVATFYKSFTLTPRGRHLVSVCLGTACHVRGAPQIAEEFERQLKIKAGETTSDKQFSLETVNCLGACALGPIVVVDGHYFSKVSSAKVKQILKKTRQGLDVVEIKGDHRIFPMTVKCPRCNHALMDSDYQIDGYPAVRMTASFGRKHGWIRMSCLYGSYSVESEYVVPADAIVNFFCPHCHMELTGATRCSRCDAPMVPMLVDGGGMVQICTRHGCNEHRLDLNGVNI